jgi:predicted ATPase
LTKPLSLKTLGQFTITLDGKPIKGLASRKAEALLVYLACTKQVHAREHLATLLWDDRPLGRSLGNLSVIVNSLKKQLEDFLEIQRNSIALKAGDRIWLDVDEVRDALEELHDAGEEGAGIPAAKREELDEALGQYRGAFLQGFHLREARGFEEWVSLERERIGRQVLVGWRRLSEAYRKSGELDSTIRCLRNAIEIDPLHEDLHRKLMRALALSGRYSEAIAQYRACAQALNAELEIEPALETRRLLDRILDRRERPGDELPALTTVTVGREQEIDQTVGQLLELDTCLLTLVGAGGIGKTRLAIETARRLQGAFLEGICFVDLAPLDHPDQVLQTIGRELSIPEGPATDGSDDPAIISLERLQDFVRDKELLLVLDNCEHLLEACGPIAEGLLRSCPSLKILTTSRERFDTPEEHLFSVEPLPVPEEEAMEAVDVDVLQENDSIRLFTERAGAVRSPFVLTDDNAALMVHICRMLDGMPLAIELTASRLHSFSLLQIARELEQSIQLLGRDHRGAIPRHQTLEAALDWSYRLLEKDEQTLFRMATAFRGGFDQPAFNTLALEFGMETVSAERILSQLVEKSLIMTREVGESAIRYVHQVQEAHAAFYLQLALAIGPRLLGRERKALIHGFDSDADNLRKSLRYQLEQNRVDECLQFAHAVWESYWLNHGYFSEGLDWINRILSITDESMGFLYGSVRLARGAFAWTLGNNDEAMIHILQALEHARRIGDAYLTQWSLYWRAFVVFDQSEFTEASELLQEAHTIAVDAGHTRGAAWAVFYLAQVARVRGQIERAISLFKESLDVLSDLDIFGAGWCNIYLGHMSLEQQKLALAREYFNKSQEIFGELDNLRGLGGTERGFGLLELEAGNLELAEEHFRRSRRYFDRLGWIKMSNSSDIYLGFVAVLEDRVEEASDLLIESLQYHHDERDWHMVAQLLFILGLLAIRRKEHRVGSELIGTAEGMQDELTVIFPLHLIRAIERAKQDPTFVDADRKNLRPWNEYVKRILGEQEDWIEGLKDT